MTDDSVKHYSGIDDEPRGVCRAARPARPGLPAYLCTRDKGHEGGHTAQVVGGRVVAKWTEPDGEKMGPCIVCGEPARHQVDPYRDEICDDQTPVPLHDGECLQDRRDEI